MPLTQVSSRAIEDTLRYVLGASGTNHYTFTGKGLTGAVNDPTLTLSRGHTYIFENRNSNGAHPFYIKTSIANGGTNDAYNTGVTNNGGAGGTEIIFTVPHDAPDLLYYQCSSHSNMAGQLKIAGAVADGSITTAKLAADAVDGTKIADDAINSEHYVDGSIDTAHIADQAISSAKIATDAVHSGKIADDAIGTEHIQDQAITSPLIAAESVTLAKLEHGTSSNDGKFLRANNGADPTFETITIPSSFVAGMILIWSGAANAIPSGWNLCDGTNGTPNLTERFVVGAGGGGNSSVDSNPYSVGDTGGASSVTLTVNQIPSHSHSAQRVGYSGGTHGWRQNGTGQGAFSTGNTGGGAAHENRPPYYALCYIMKT